MNDHMEIQFSGRNFAKKFSNTFRFIGLSFSVSFAMNLINQIASTLYQIMRKTWDVAKGFIRTKILFPLGSLSSEGE